ncbi:hypothetical protein ACOSP7_014588 [Xanthoceras sorbifolium]
MTKDLKSKRVSLGGALKNGLYQMAFIKDDYRLQSGITARDRAVVFLSQIPLNSCNASNIAHPSNYVFVCSASSYVPCTNNSTCAAIVNKNKTSINEDCTLDLWHARLGHHAPSVITTALQLQPTVKISSITFNFCESCKYCKLRQLPFAHSHFKASCPLDLIFSNV